LSAACRRRRAGCATIDDVAVADLLLRPSERVDYARLEGLVKGNAVNVIGGGGSIGFGGCDHGRVELCLLSSKNA